MYHLWLLTEKADFVFHRLDAVAQIVLGSMV
jgi:hypothetical protein